MDQTDREILGYSRYVVLAAAFSAMEGHQAVPQAARGHVGLGLRLRRE